MRLEGRTAAKKPGTLICGKWKVERVVRVTEQLATYEAKDPSGIKVYVKVIHPYKADDAPLVARLKREAYVANRIKHPSMVRVLGDGVTDEGSVAIALEMVDGETLEELRVKRGGLLPPDEVVKLGLALCDALGAAHDERVIHRDVRPESFMITKKGEIRVPEFAAARVMGEEVEARERTAAGTTLGSPAFMSPEQARGQRDRVDARSDVFGLGAALYTLVSGKTVHAADNPLAGLLAASRDRAKPVRTVMRTPIPDFLADAIDKALKFEPVDRFPTMRAFRKALEGGAPAAKPAPPPLARPQSGPNLDPGAARPSQMPPPPLAGRAAIPGAPASPLLGRPAGPSFPPAPAPAPAFSQAQSPSRPPPAYPPTQASPSRPPAPDLAHPTAVAPNVPRAPSMPVIAAPEPPRERMAKPELPRHDAGDEVNALMPLPPPGAAAYGAEGGMTSPRASTAASPAYGPPPSPHDAAMGYGVPAPMHGAHGPAAQPMMQGMQGGPMGQPMMQQPMGQPMMQGGPMGQPMMQGGPMGQPMMPGGPMGQPMMPGGPMGQPMMPGGPMGQPMMPGGPMGQPMMQGGPMGQPMMQGGPMMPGQPMMPGGPMGQPMMQGGPMGQPMMPGQPMMGAGMGQAGASGGYAMQAPGTAPKPNRTLAIVAGSVGLVLILCAVVYAMVFFRSG